MLAETQPLEFFVNQGLLFALPDFLTAAEIQDLHPRLAQQTTAKAPVVSQIGIQSKQYDRKTAQIAVSDDLRHLISDRMIALRSQLEGFFQLQLNGLEPPSFLKYMPGDYFKPHRDWQPEFAHHPGMSHLPPRQISTIVLLSHAVAQPHHRDQYSGGELVFYLPTEALGHKLIGLPLLPPCGTLIAFRSDLIHEVKAVLGGQRISVVAWLF